MPLSTIHVVLKGASPSPSATKSRVTMRSPTDTTLSPGTIHTPLVPSLPATPPVPSTPRLSSTPIDGELPRRIAVASLLESLKG